MASSSSIAPSAAEAERARGRGLARLLLRTLGLLLALGGALLLVWALLVWRWQDPITLLVNERHQARLASAYEERLAEARAHARSRPRPAPRSPRELARAAAAYRRTLATGDPVGRLVVPRLGLRAIVVLGTDAASLQKGPGLHPGTGLPGQGRLIYVAGHRTTYGAPFSDIDALRPGDPIVLELPYGTFRYRVTGHRIVPATELSVLRSRGREELALQACWPRFFASHRYLAYARPIRP